MSSQENTTRRAGIADFVPEESAARKFAARFHPRLAALTARLRECGIETLLDAHRLLALTELARHAARLKGELIELGVYRGGSAAAVAWTLEQADTRRTIHLCDTFAGLPAPQDWEQHCAGDFEDTAQGEVESALRRLLPDYPFELHVGLFAETLPALAEKRFCFAHVDADLYESVREACEFVYPRMTRGGFIVFDDYGAPTCPGAKRAVDEFFADKLERPRHVAQCAYGVQMGEAEANFERIVLGNTLLPASAGALRQLPRRSAGAVARRILPALTSAKAARALAEPVFRLRARREGSTELALCRMKNILVVRLDEIGDVVLNSPFLRELRRSAPAAHITLLVKPGTRNLVERCPHVDEVLTFDGSARGQLAALEVRARTWKMARKELWPQRFDLAILPRWDADYTHATFLAYFSGAAARIGFSESVNRVKQQINRGNDQLLTHALYDHAAKHEVEHNLDVLRALGGEVHDTRLELWLAPEDEAFAEKTVAAHVGARLVAFGVGAGARKRRWPVSRFVEIGRWLCGEMPTRIVVVGGAEDGLAAEKLERELGIAVFNLTGKATLRQTAAVMKRCELFIGNDAGPMHMAAAAGVPVIEICCQHRGGAPLDANSPTRFGPWGVESVVLQPEKAAGNCGETCEAEMAHCILGVSAEQVQEVVIQFLQKTRAGVAGKR